MAEENQAQEANNQSAKSGGGGGMLPALLIIALMPVISFAMFKFVFLPELKNLTPEEGAAQGHHEEIDPEKIHVESGEKYLVDFPDILVNVKGVILTRYFRVSFTIESANPEIEAEVNANMAAMKDLAGTILGNLTLAHHEQPEIKNLVESQLKQGFDKILQPPMVDEIHFTNWVVQ